jgi:hypothetical protein
MGPEGRASRPTTTTGLFSRPAILRLIHPANPVVNLTTSGGVNPSPARPPMVPRMPDMDLINATEKSFGYKYNRHHSLSLPLLHPLVSTISFKQNECERLSLSTFDHPLFTSS